MARPRVQVARSVSRCWSRGGAAGRAGSKSTPCMQVDDDQHEQAGHHHRRGRTHIPLPTGSASRQPVGRRPLSRDGGPGNTGPRKSGIPFGCHQQYTHRPADDHRCSTGKYRQINAWFALGLGASSHNAKYTLRRPADSTAPREPGSPGPAHREKCATAQTGEPAGITPLRSRMRSISAAVGPGGADVRRRRRQQAGEPRRVGRPDDRLLDQEHPRIAKAGAPTTLRVPTARSRPSSPHGASPRARSVADVAVDRRSVIRGI